MVQGQRPWLVGPGTKLPKAETLLASGRAIEAASLPAFQYLCCIAKITLNKSHLGMRALCRHQNFFMGAAGGKARAKPSF